MTPSMTLLVVVAVAAPGTVVLVAATTQRRWAPGRIETAAIATAGGLIAAALVAQAAPTAVPLCVLGPAAAVVDVHEYRLPDVLTLPLLAATVVIAAFGGPSGLHGLVVGCVAVLVVIGLKLVATDAIGWGDVKLLPTIAIVLDQLGGTLAGTTCAVALIAATAMVVSAIDRGAAVPYGPALVLGPLAFLGVGGG